MKKLIYVCMVYFIGFSPINSNAQDLSPYIKVGTLTDSMPTVVDNVIQTLTANNFEILGEYSPENNTNLHVIAFTRTDLKNTVSKVKDRGVLAAILKVGLVKNGENVTMSYVNPMYIFNAYLRKETPNHRQVLEQVAIDVKSALANIGNEFVGFGGSVSAKKLWKYHYKVFMPYFSDPEVLNTYASFEEGLNIIETNLSKNKSATKLVYKLVLADKKTAVFGVALLDKEKGEAIFLPKIGEENIAAMPYEIILQGKAVTMLRGKYRLAVSWPELTMGTFMKIMSTPGDIEDMLRSITE